MLAGTVLGAGGHFTWMESGTFYGRNFSRLSCCSGEELAVQSHVLGWLQERVGA